MKRFLPLLFVLQMKAQTNLFRMYLLSQPPFNGRYVYADSKVPVKTNDGGIWFTSASYSGTTQQPVLCDYYTVKTNSSYAPVFKKLANLKAIPLPSGGIVSVNMGLKNRAVIEKHTAGGQSLWSKEITATLTVISNSITYNFATIQDGITYNNKIRVIGMFYNTDVSGNVTARTPFTAEYDTSSGAILSAMSLHLPNTQADYTSIYRDTQGSFYFTGPPSSGIAKFSSTFTFMWNLSWQNSVFSPNVRSLRFLPNGDLFCAMDYIDTAYSYKSPGMMRISNPANVLFEKMFLYKGNFSGLENMPNSNILFSWPYQPSPADTARVALLAVDPSGNTMWSRSYHACLAVSPPLGLGNGEFVLHSIAPRFSVSMAQQPTLFTVDQNGLSSCTSKPLSMSVRSLSTSPTLNTVTAVPITITLSPSQQNANLAINYKDTCGGAGIGFVSIENATANPEIRLAPNPARHVLHLFAPLLTGSLQVRLQSMDGRVQELILKEDRTISLSDVSRGVYLLCLLQDGKEIYRQKLLIEGP